MRPTLGVGAVILEGDRVCLVRRAHPPLAGRWSLPGGKVEGGERLAEALEREVREETGLEVEVGELLEVVEILEGERHFVVLDYRCAIVGGALAAGDDAAEVAMAPLDALDDYAVSEAVRRVVALGAKKMHAPR